MFPEVWNTVYCPKNLDTKNMKLLLEIEQMFNDKFGGQPKWEFDEEKGMYKTLIFFGAILPVFSSNDAKYNSLNKYGFLNKDLKPFFVKLKN